MLPEAQHELLRAADRVAVFDIDGTLYDVNTAFGFLEDLHRGRATARWLLLRSARTWVGKLVWAAVSRLASKLEFRRLAIRTLAGYGIAEVAVVAQRYVASISDRAHQVIGLELRERTEEGSLVVLVSGSLQPVVDAVVAHVGADFGLGAGLEVEGDRCTGRLRSDVRGRKHELLHDIADQPGHLFVATDNREDLGLVLRADRSVVVSRPRHRRWWQEHAPASRIVEVAQ